MYIIFLMHFVTTLFMLGLIWFVQIVHYPLLSSIAPEVFSRYEVSHVLLTTSLTAIPMLIELITAWLLLWKKIPYISGRMWWINFALLVVIWTVSLCVQVPLHFKLFSGFDPNSHYYLVCSNWIRTILWSVRAFLLTGVVYRLLNKLPQENR